MLAPPSQTFCTTYGARKAKYLTRGGILGNDGKAEIDTSLLTALDSPVKSMWENFLMGHDRSEDKNFLGYREKRDDGSFEGYTWMTYSHVNKLVHSWADALHNRGISTGERIGIFSLNTPEWMILDLTCYLGNFVSVPLYTSFDEDALCHIITQTEMKVIFASGSKAKDLMRLPFDRVRDLRTIVVLDDLLPTDKEMKIYEAAFDNMPEIVSMTAYTQSFTDKAIAYKPFAGESAKLEDVATICYTSGTTGKPKGVVLTHANLLSELVALEYAGKVKKMFTPQPNDIHISYLPLAHIFERVVAAYVTRVGGQIGFYRGITGANASTALMEDLSELRPTIFVSVPRVYNRLYEKVLKTVNEKGSMQKGLFEKATDTKLRNLKERGKTSHFIWDNLIFSKLRASLGGRVRVLVTGSAPLASKVLDFLRIAFSAEVYEGYGQTETTSGITLTLRGDLDSGHVGCPLGNCEIMLMDVPEMNYTAKDFPFPRGEICVRGSQVFKEYYKDPEKTFEVFTDDGWYKTGDIGMWDGFGRLVVIDRKSSMFKLAQGEFVSPEKIESAIATNCDLVSGIFVTGDPIESYLVAIVVPDMEAIADHNMSGDVREYILKQITKVAKEAKLHGYEIPKKIYLEEDGVPEEIMTPTFKVKRPVAKRYYSDKIKAMYTGAMQSPP